MADNFQVTAGVGTTVATKDASGVHHPKQLIEIDVSGTPTPISSSAPMPVNGTLTANIGTSGNLALDATLTAGAQKAIARGGVKGTSAAADITSTASGANHQALDVVLYDTMGNAITAFGGGTQYAEDAAHTSGHIGTMSLAVRQDALSPLAGSDGDYIPLTTDEQGRLQVTPGKVVNVSVTPTISTTAYASGDNVGGKLTFAGSVRHSGGSARVRNVIVVDQDKENAPIDLLFFDADPTATTFSDNGAMDIADSDMSKLVARVALVDWCAFNDNSVCSVCNLDVPFKLASGSSLFGALIIRGTATYTATSDMIVKLVIEQD